MNGTTRRSDERTGARPHPTGGTAYRRLRARRTEVELEVLLAERLAILRAPTGQSSMDLDAGDGFDADSGLPNAMRQLATGWRHAT